MTNWSDLSLFVGAVSASLASLILAVQKSKCSTIDCGCVHCQRVVEMTSLDDPDAEPESDPTPPPQPKPVRRDGPVRLRDLEESLKNPTDPGEVV